MMSNKGDAQEKLQCPYEKAHIVDKHRMQVHLVKCGRGFPDFKIVNCQFNTTHCVPEPEMKYHLSICPDRVQIDKFTYKSDNAQGADVLFPIPKLNIEPTEYWDNQEDVPTYDPDAHCKRNPILRNTKTKSAAQRRNFHMEERARWQQFDKVEHPHNNQQSEASQLQKQRRPAGKSVGIQNDDKQLDVCDLMEQITLNADVLTTPKVPVVARKSQESQKPAATNENDPPLDNDLDNHTFKASVPWGAASLAMQGIASNSEPTKRSYGRGSFLAKKN